MLLTQPASSTAAGRSISSKPLSIPPALSGGTAPPPSRALRPYLRLDGEPEGEQLKDLAQRHGISPGAISMHLHRLRQLWRQAVLKHIKATLENPTDDEANAELSVLLSRL